MKRKGTVKFVGLLLLSVTLLSNVAAKKPVKVPSILETKQRFVKVSERLYADKYEATVKDYQLFLAEQKSKGTDCSSLMYDSTLWQFEGEMLLMMNSQDYYFNSSYMADCPIVCISYSAAQQFCQWLTEKYNADPHKKYAKVLFRLPTKQEYTKAAIGKSIYSEETIYPWGYGGLLKQGEKRCNFWNIMQEMIDYREGQLQNSSFELLFTANIGYVYAYEPNTIGLYNVIGNAAEMIQEEGIAMGGSWLSSGANVGITSEQKYEKPSCTVGFRVFMEIMQE